MALSQKLVQKQTQTINLSNQLRQAIEILEMSFLDLNAHIQTKILENPFLEMGEAKAEGQSESEKHSDSQEENTSESEHGDDWGESRQPAHSSSSSSFAQGDKFSNIAANDISLREHLLSQINTDIDDEHDRLIAYNLLDHLDETGYLRTPIAKIAEVLGAREQAVAKVLAKVKEFDPAGIFAQSLRECMELQLKELGALDEKTRLVLEYIDLFADAKIQDLLRKTGCTVTEFQGIIQRFKRLDPKPGLKFNNAIAQPIIPDVFIKRGKGEKGWYLSLNPETLPQVIVNQDYKASTGINTKRDKELQKYYNERMGEANWLVRALDQRAQNILKVVTEIVNQQEKFFADGAEYLKPMNLNKVATAIDLHESTVSRITQNKYLSCSRGTFELKYFFSASITNAWTGEDQSALQIQHKIKTLVTQENHKSPLSDDMLVRKLSESNLDIARRTVAKYRELLKIPSSYERKKRYLRGI